MQRETLSEFVEENGQAVAASVLGVTQGAISKALRAGRTIYVQQGEDGSYTAEELKPFPAKQTAA